MIGGEVLCSSAQGSRRRLAHESLLGFGEGSGYSGAGREPTRMMRKLLAPVPGSVALADAMSMQISTQAGTTTSGEAVNFPFFGRPPEGGKNAQMLAARQQIYPANSKRMSARRSTSSDRLR